MAKLTKKNRHYDKNGESGENFPRFLRIFKLDGTPLGSGDFDQNGENLQAMVKMANLAKNRLRADENLYEASRGAPC